jgi:hypothetical protein
MRRCVPHARRCADKKINNKKTKIVVKSLTQQMSKPVNLLKQRLIYDR